MVCPVDQTPLVMSDRQGVEIDYCPKCRGVWLDRGELDKIIERSDSGVAQAEPERHREPNSREEVRYSDQHRKRKKESFLGDLFDFGD